MDKRRILEVFNDKKDIRSLTFRHDVGVSIADIWKIFTNIDSLSDWLMLSQTTVETEIMDFEANGEWFYSIIDPDGFKTWNRIDFIDIKPLRSVSAFYAVCDESGVMYTEYLPFFIKVDFSENDEATSIDVQVFYNDNVINKLTVINAIVSKIEDLEELINAKKERKQLSNVRVLK